MKANHLLASALLVTLAASAVSGQSLADVAKRTDDGRKTGDRASRTYAIGSDDGLRLTALDKPLVELYVRLRVDMAHTWTRDRGVFQRLEAGAVSARSIDELCRVLEEEPAIAALFAKYQYTSYAFLSVTQSLHNARELAEGFDPRVRLTPVQRLNYTFIGQNGAWVSAMRGRYLTAERGLSIWP